MYAQALTYAACIVTLLLQVDQVSLVRVFGKRQFPNMAVKSVIGPGEGILRWLKYNFMLIYWCVYIGGGVVVNVHVIEENAYWALVLVTMSQVGVLAYVILVMLGTCYPSCDGVIRRTHGWIYIYIYIYIYFNCYCRW